MQFRIHDMPYNDWHIDWSMFDSAFGEQQQH